MKSILSKEQLQLTLKRLAEQVTEDVPALHDVVFIGIQPRGIFVAERIVEIIRQNNPGAEIQYGMLDITFYRDDVREGLHEAKETSITTSLTGKHVILIDDVLFTGRTIRAALDAIQDFGRPEKVELAVLVDRRFTRELPIEPTFTGIAVNSLHNQKIKADWLQETVWLYD